MDLSVELLLGIGLAVCVPLLSVIATCLIFIAHTLRGFDATLKKVDRSLDHNRNEHTKMLASIDALHESIEGRIDLLEERIKQK